MKRAVFAFAVTIVVLLSAGSANAFILDFSDLDFLSDPTGSFNEFGENLYYDDVNADTEPYTLPDTYYYYSDETYFDDHNIDHATDDLVDKAALIQVRISFGDNIVLPTKQLGFH